jgi:hypothetical protein
MQLKMCPAMLNIRSTAAELAGTPKYFLANLDSSLNLKSFFFQNSKVDINSKFVSFVTLIKSLISSSIVLQ